MRELEYLVAYGMTPAAALDAATLSGAKLMGLGDEIGSVEPGKRADLVVVDGDPLDISSLRHRVRAFYQDGRLVHGSPAPARECQQSAERRARPCDALSGRTQPSR